MYENTKVIDVHSHVAMPSAINGHLAAMVGVNSALPSPFRRGRETGVYGGRLDYGKAVTGEKSSPEQRLEDLGELSTFVDEVEYHVGYIDDRRIDVQVIGPRPYMVAGWAPPEVVVAWSQFVNDLIAWQCALYPDRFRGACQLPMRSTEPDTTHVLMELNRCIDDLGFVAAYAAPDPSGRRETPGMHDPYWYPLYQRCIELDIPLIVHGTTSFDPRFSGVPLNYQMAFAIEQYIAHQCLRWGGVFERFPELRTVICHCGPVLDRFLPHDEAHIPQADMSANLFFDTCAYNEVLLEAVIKQRGVSQLCFGAEAPGSGGCPRLEGAGKTADDLVPVISAFDFLSASDCVAIFAGNAKRVFPAGNFG